MKNLNVVHNVQKGFTLIELMIVVAIIGILAALAIPAYQDYTIRSKVSEAASLSGSAKTSVDIYFSEGGDVTPLTATVADNHATLGISNAQSYKAKYVSSVSVGDDGAITVQMKNDATLGLGGANNGTVIYTPTSRGGNLQWGVTGTVPTKYRPKS